MHPTKTLPFLKSTPPSSTSGRGHELSTTTDEPATFAPTTHGRPLARLHNPFRRSNSSSPAPAPTMSSIDDVPRGGQYLDVIDLKFADAVSKALANPSGPHPPALPTSDPCLIILQGRKPLPPGRGTALGNLIIEELKASSSDVHLHRAILRLMHRPLSVLHNNLSSMLLRVLPYLETSSLAQCHALAFATLAAELIESMDSIALGSSGDNSARGDGLRGIRDGLESLVKRVIAPLFTMIKLELSPIIDTLAHPRLALFSSLPGRIPQSAMASLLIGLVWHSLVALSSRPLPGATLYSTNNKPALAAPKVKKDSSFTFSRPSSSSSSHAIATAVSGATATASPPATPRFIGLPIPPFLDLHLRRLFLDAQGTLSLMTTLPSPAVGSFAREAVDEAYDAFDAFLGFLKWAVSLASASDPIGPEELWSALLEKTENVPVLIALPVLLHLLPRLQLMSLIVPVNGDGDESKNSAAPTVTVSSLIGIPEDEYRSSCLTGFGRAEVCIEAVGRGVLDRFQLSEEGSGACTPPSKEGPTSGKEGFSEHGVIDGRVILLRWTALDEPCLHGIYKFRFLSLLRILIMIDSLPPKAVHGTPAQIGMDPRSRSLSVHVSTSSPTGVMQTLTARSPRPVLASRTRNAQLENLISERNAAWKDAAVTKEEKNFALREIRQHSYKRSNTGLNYVLRFAPLSYTESFVLVDAYSLLQVIHDMGIIL
ncbi:hypothetical protein BS47DRAFT_1394106 [Hydnum rufescens UP504]|uniref:Uncharacterized protein n=1 Tax=Hydnum rufescens UP504 TaxID=1448309 RepID=A0A9P6AXB1_9AGAM|nr:hypothetical protein BS47DRAFT_1394106 [Hydnum rufescens UP504]